MYLTLLAYFTQSRSLVTLSIVNNRVCIIPVYSKNYRSQPQLQARGLTKGSKNKRKKRKERKCALRSVFAIMSLIRPSNGADNSTLNPSKWTALLFSAPCAKEWENIERRAQEVYTDT